MSSKSVSHRIGKISLHTLCCAFLLLALPWITHAHSLGSAEIPVLGLQVSVDTNPDKQGMNSAMTAVKNFPTAVTTFVGFLGEETLPPDLPQEWVVRADLSGPGSEIRHLSAVPNQLMEIPAPKVSGDYFLFNIRLEDGEGNILLERDSSLDPVIITVIDKLLVTQVTSRPLTADEILEKGIVIDEDNYTGMNFSVGLTIGTSEVNIDLPMLIPTNNQNVAVIPPGSATFQYEPERFKGVDIPNFTMVGFTLRVPDDPETAKLELPPISGVIVIPGNIAFLNQFFSVILQASNIAPEGSGLVLENARAGIELPLGDDSISGSGDDPLGLAQTASGGIQDELPLLDQEGSDSVAPQGTNNAEFLVEGLAQGTHTVRFNILGDLYIPSLGKTVSMTGRAAGSVQVRNPTFNIVLAHPDTIREDEEYSLFATVTNTSASPANMFQLNLSSRSLSGAALADGETGLKTLDTLGPGQAETFEYRLKARTTGKVTGTVFLADQSVNGSFVLKTGVGDTGIPLSPDTLVLPRTTDYLPDTPADIVPAAVRLLGQAYSVATSPAGALPPDISRVSKTYVFDRAVRLAQAGLHAGFGEDPLATTEDILMDYFGNDLGRLTSLYNPEEIKVVTDDIKAFDSLRRNTEAGHNLSHVLGSLIGWWSLGKSLAEIQLDWAELFASRPAHLSFGVSTGDRVCLMMTDSSGRVLGSLGEDPDLVAREIPFADSLTLSQDASLLFAASPDPGTYTFEFLFPQGTTGADISLILPGDNGEMSHAVYPQVSLPGNSHGRITYSPGNLSALEIDTTGTGVFDMILDPLSVSPVTDRPPSLISVRQWAKKDMPVTKTDFTTGDPLGRMAGVLFSEEVGKELAENRNSYAMPAHNIEDIRLQPDRRMVFLMLREPAGSLVSRDLTVTGISDMSGRVMQDESLELSGDQERGGAGVVSGIVQDPNGNPVPFARIKYLQPVYCPDCDFGKGWIKDYVVSELMADSQGWYQIDFVLMNGHTKSDNPDIWLNENHAGGTGNFKLEAADPMTGDIGRASTRIRYDGQHMNLSIIIRGYGSIEGTVYDESGLPVTGGLPGQVPVYAKNISTGESYVSWIDSQGSYAFPREETGHTAPRLAVGNTVLRVMLSNYKNTGRYLTGIVTANIPAPGMTVTRDIFLEDSASYGTVSGRVLENGGQTGAPGVFVQVQGELLTRLGLYSREYVKTVVGSAHTDENGFFRFENVPAGDIRVRAIRQSTYEQTEAGSWLQGDDETSLTLILPGTNGRVRGYVEDALGGKVEGAKVMAGPGITQTDENGDFMLAGLPMGKFRIYAQAPDSLATGQAEADIISSDDIVTVRITLEPVGTIRGTVYKADGQTVAGFQKVQLWLGDRAVIGETYTTAAGEYRFSDYPVSDYSVRAVESDYGDGGMALTAIRFPGDVRDADILFRGMAEIRGQVIQKINETDTTPVLSDVIITRKVWRIIPGKNSNENNYYLDFADKIEQEADEDTAERIRKIMDETGATAPPAEFFMLTDEPVLVRSDIPGPDGSVTGEFRFAGPATGGPFTVAAFGPFLAPTEKTGMIPWAGSTDVQVVNVDPIILEPTVGEVTGTVYLPDSVTPAGPGVLVRIRSLDSSGEIRIPGNYGGSVEQPVMPEITVSTDDQGRFVISPVLRGRFVMTADTGVPDPEIKAGSPGDISTGFFAGQDDTRLKVRLYGRTTGSVPAGQTMNADIRLANVAGVTVTVVQKGSGDEDIPVHGARVTFGTESVLDSQEEADFTGNTGADGKISFFPVIEGRFSVSAVILGTPVTGRAEGMVSADLHGGDREISVKVTLGAVTTAAGEVISAPAFGTVTGTVHKADGRVLANPAEIRVGSAGVSILTTSSETGTYRAEHVPAGSISVRAFEPLTSRRGTGTGLISAQDEEISIPVTLEGLGSVTGQVMNAGGTEVISGADVILFASGRFTDPLVTRTDPGGAYHLPGVPMGDYTVRATHYTDGGISLAGETSGNMPGDGESSTSDIFLEPAGSVAGTLYAAGTVLDSQGIPVSGSAQTVSSATVTITGPGGSRTLVTDASGYFSSDSSLRMGSHTLTARPQDQAGDGATGSAALTYDGQKAVANMVLRGTGLVRGTVTDSCTSGTPVSNADVTLHSTSLFSSGHKNTITDHEGKFAFDKVPAGEFFLSIRQGGMGLLGASASGKIENHAQEAVFDPVCLQSAGKVTGKVVFPDGAAAPGAVAEIRAAPGDIRLARVCDSTGEFSFEGLPLGKYQVSVHEPVTNGVGAREAELASDGDAAELGLIALDTEAPSVVLTQPAPDAADADTAVHITVTFSEEIDSLSVSPGTFQVKADGVPVTGTLGVSGSAVTFEPGGLLPDLSRITVLVKGDKLGFEGQVLESGIRDTAGLGMVSDYALTFTTRDTTPPAIVKVSPASGASETDPASVIRAEFSEPVHAESVRQSLILRTGDTDVPGVVNDKPILGDRVFVFTPDTPLETDRTYTALLTGPVRDLAGNILPGGTAVTSFATTDTKAPVIQSLVYSGIPVRGATLEITAETSDADRVEFHVAGQLAGTDTEAPYTHSLHLGQNIGNPALVRAVAADAAENRGDPAELSITVAENQAPLVTVTLPGGNTASPGQTVAVHAEATDDTGIAGMSFEADRGTVAGGTKDVGGALSASADFTFTVPGDHPGDIRIRASAWDAPGLSSFSDEITLTVADTAAPKVVIGSPAENSVFGPGAEVPVFVRAEDTRAVTKIRLSTQGAAVVNKEQGFDGSSSLVTHTFTFSMPQAQAPAGEPVVITAAAEDSSGNTGMSAPVTVFMSDTSGPSVAGIMPADGAAGVPVSTDISVVFSEAADPATVSPGSFSVTSASGTAVPGVCVLTENNTRAVWLPRQGFEFGASYDVALTGDITDEAGNALIPFTSSFTVTDFAVTEPLNRAKVVEGQSILIKAEGTSAAGISSVVFYAGGTEISSVTSAPYETVYQIPGLAELGTPVLDISAEAVAGGTNIALAASVSGSPETYSYDFHPSRAADGNPEPGLPGGSVAVVIGDPRPWWEADTGRTMLIGNMRIVLMQGCCQESNRFAVLTAPEPFEESDFSGPGLPVTYSNNAQEAYRTGPGHDTGTVTVTGPFAGRYVRIVGLEEKFLALAEAEIYEKASVAGMAGAQVHVYASDGDEDGDGVSNGDEIAAGTDPFNR